jgi:hypothetical protein
MKKNLVLMDCCRFDFEGKTLSVSGYFPEIKKECQYELDGKVLLLAVKGTGPSTVVLSK